MTLLTNDAYQKLKDRIMTLELKPGAPLQEADLANQFGVSRTPIREALRRLEADGLVQILPGRGAQVAQVSIQDFVDAYEARQWLEPAAAAKAARTVDEETLSRLGAALQCMPAQPYGPEELATFERADLEIHDLILQAAGNRLVQSLVQEARTITRRTERLVSPARHLRAREEHRAIVEALELRDSEAAEQEMRKHIIAARERILRAMVSQTGGH